MIPGYDETPVVAHMKGTGSRDRDRYRPGPRQGHRLDLRPDARLHRHQRFVPKLIDIDAPDQRAGRTIRGFVQRAVAVRTLAAAPAAKRSVMVVPFARAAHRHPAPRRASPPAPIRLRTPARARDIGIGTGHVVGDADVDMIARAGGEQKPAGRRRMEAARQQDPPAGRRAPRHASARTSRDGTAISAWKMAGHDGGETFQGQTQGGTGIRPANSAGSGIARPTSVQSETAVGISTHGAAWPWPSCCASRQRKKRRMRPSAARRYVIQIVITMHDPMITGSGSSITNKR